MSKKESTLRCVLVLAVIAVICALLLAVLNPLLYVAPSIDDLSNNFSLIENGFTETAEWQMGKVDDNYYKQTGGKVTMVGSVTEGTKTVYGILVKTNSDGKLGECDYAIYIDKSTNTIISMAIVTDGATSGRDYNYALANVQKGTVKNIAEYYGTVIDGDSLFTDFTEPKCGATRTVKSVNSAFRIASNYYYNVYVKGDK